jgi:hypothetical protein
MGEAHRQRTFIGTDDPSSQHKSNTHSVVKVGMKKEGSV